jgi:hypothetical protein
MVGAKRLGFNGDVEQPNAKLTLIDFPSTMPRYRVPVNSPKDPRKDPRSMGKTELIN